MAEVRAQPGVPLAAAFGGLGAPTLCAPIVVDSLTGYGYTLKTGDVVVQLYSASAESSVIESRTFVPQPFTQLIGNSQSVMEARTFSPRVVNQLFQPDSVPILAGQIFGG